MKPLESDTRPPSIEELQNTNRAYRRMWGKKLGVKIRGTQDSAKLVHTIHNPIDFKEAMKAGMKALVGNKAIVKEIGDYKIVVSKDEEKPKKTRKKKAE